MTQKLLVMERDTREELMKAIRNNILEADNSSRISAISVIQTSRVNDDNMVIESNEAWIIVEVPENKDRLYEYVSAIQRNNNDDKMGMTE